MLQFCAKLVGRALHRLRRVAHVQLASLPVRVATTKLPQHAQLAQLEGLEVFACA